MKTTTKTSLKKNNPEELPDDIAALFAAAPQLDEAGVRRLKAASRELDRDPDFIADYLKGLAVEDILRAMEEADVSKSELANRIGKSRQYVSNVLNESARVNFTIDTLAQFAVALDRQLSVRILSHSQQMHVMRTMPTTISPGLEFDSKTAATFDFAVSDTEFKTTRISKFRLQTAIQENEPFTTAA